MKKITKGVGFSTDGCGWIEKFKLEFDKADIEKIKICQALIKKHDLSSIDIRFEAEIIHDDDFTPDSTPVLKVFNDCLYYCCQSKYDAGVQYESEQILNEELGL
jgi:hypothetical protein